MHKSPSPNTRNRICHFDWFLFCIPRWPHCVPPAGRFFPSFARPSPWWWSGCAVGMTPEAAFVLLMMMVWRKNSSFHPIRWRALLSWRRTKRWQKKDSSDEILPTRTNVSDGMTIGTLRRSAVAGDGVSLWMGKWFVFRRFVRARKNKTNYFWFRF